MRKLAVLAAAAMLVLAGCSGSPEPAPSPTATPDDRLPIGATFNGQTVDITVTKFERKVKSGVGEVPLMEAAYVRTCLKNIEEPTDLSWSPWEVVTPAGESYLPSEWQAGKKPLYPNGLRTYKAGECAQGWIMFESHEKGGTTLRYENDTHDIGRWKIG